VASAALEQVRQFLVGHQHQVHLDDGGHVENALGPVEPGEVVEGQGEALVEQALATLDHLVVDDDGLEDLDHRPLGREHDRDVTDQGAPTGIAEDEAVAGQPVDPDLDGIEEDLGCHQIALEVIVGLPGREGVFGRAEQQLVAHDVEMPVEDRLARHDDLGARCRERAFAHLHHLDAPIRFVLPLVTTGGVLSYSSMNPTQAAGPRRDADNNTIGTAGPELKGNRVPAGRSPDVVALLGSGSRGTLKMPRSTVDMESKSVREGVGSHLGHRVWRAVVRPGLATAVAGRADHKEVERCGSSSLTTAGRCA